MRLSIPGVRHCAICVLLLAVLGCGKGEKPSPVAVGAPAPELDGALTWVNSPPLQLAGLRGKVVLLDFFEYSCVNCIRTFPYIKDWIRRYADDGLVVIGVHMPQYGFSMDPNNVEGAARRLELSYPIAVDSDLKIGETYANRFWPRKFLIDKDGRIRFEHTGEGAYEETERMIQTLLREIDAGKTFPEPLAPLRDVDRPGAVCYPITPELYLGYVRGVLGNNETGVTNAPVTLTAPDELREGVIYAVGEWANHSEYLRHTRDTEALTDSIVLRYRAVEVNVVMKPEDVYWKHVFVRRDGEWIPRDIAGADIKYDEDDRSYVEVRAARMYNLIANQPYGVHELRLSTFGKGLSVYSFSFGTCVIPKDADTLRPAKETS
jgi:thiol-disulfide isomerase/thioredoxin